MIDHNYKIYDYSGACRPMTALVAVLEHITDVITYLLIYDV